jgi:hypothetical protein
VKAITLLFFGGRNQLSLLPPEQFHIEPVFQLLDAGSDVRLPAVQLGGLGNPAKVRDGLEYL